MCYIFCRVSYQSPISSFISSIDFKCHRHRNQKNPNPVHAHAACAAKNSQKKEENASVAQRVITKRAVSATRRSSQAKE